jgi:hypothetical protein
VRAVEVDRRIVAVHPLDVFVAACASANATAAAREK